MAGFLKAISAVYLIIIWSVVAVAALSPALSKMGKVAVGGLEHGAWVVGLVISGILASIPAALLYAFGQVVADVRSMRNHLAAMRRYYQPNAPHDDYR